MELSLDIEQLQLKSEHLHANPKHTHYHENNTDPLFVSWDDCVTVLYPLNCLADATLWNPIEPSILPLSDPVISVLTFDSNVYCIDKIGSIHHLKQVQRDSPDLFDYSSSSQISQLLPSSNYEWKNFYSQKCPCDIFGATYYSDGISLIAKVGQWIIIQFLRITINDNNEPIVFNTCSKQIRPVKQFPFLVTSFISCTWKNWFSSQRVKELFGPSTLDSQDVFIFGTSESKMYFSTSDMICKNVCLFLNCPQQIIHIQFCNFESKKLLLVSSSGILITICCIENVPSSFIYLAVTKVVTTFVVDHTVIVSDGVHFFQITLDKDFSKIVKQIVIPLKGVLTLQKFQFSNIIATTQLNKMYKLSPKYDLVTQEERFKFKFNNENSMLEDIQNLCKGIESLKEQHEKMNKYISAVSIVARKDLIAQYCSFSVLFYSGTKAIKLGAKQDEYIIAIKLSTDCSWLSFPSTVWQLFVCVTDTKNTSSNCGLHSFNTDLFDNCHPLIVKHHISATVVENCSFGLVYCALVCQIKSDLVNRYLVIPLSPVKLNSLYFVKVEKREKVAIINPLEYRHKYVLKFPEHLTLVECLTNLTNRNKHRASKSLIANIINNMPKILYFNFFGILVSIDLDDKITKTIVMECVDQDALIAVRNGVLDELSNNRLVIIKCSALSDIQKQLCLLEELSIKDQHDKNIVEEIKTKIQNQISTNLPV